MTLIKQAVSRLGGKDDLSVEMADSYRLLLITKARWLILGLLVFHWIISFAIFAIIDQSSLSISTLYNKIIDFGLYPALILIFVAGLNAFFHIGWYKLPSFWSGKTRKYLFGQIVIDVFIVLALIHFTGGVTSWLWPLFLIINLELVYLFSSSKSVFLIGSMAGIGYTILGILEYEGIIAAYQMPYLPQNLQFNLSLVALILIWVNLIGAFSLLISVYMRRGEQQELSEKIIRDGLTHLYNKKYFFDRLGTEVHRSQIYNRVFSLILLEVDDFEAYIKGVGRAESNELLRWIAEVLRMNIRRSEVQPAYELDIAAYLGDTRFAILLPETGAEQLRDVRDMPQDAKIFGAAAFTVAERIRTTVNSSKFTYGSTVTISASVVSYPIDGSNMEDIVNSAKNGLAKAQESGDNVVIVSSGNSKLSTPSLQ